MAYKDYKITIPVTVYGAEIPDDSFLKEVLEEAADYAVKAVNDRLEGLRASAVDGATVEVEET